MIIVNLSVLARPAPTIGERQPTPEGRMLWSMLFGHYMGRIVVVSDTVYDRNHLSDWLKLGGYKPSFIEMLDETDPDLKAQKVQRVGAVFGKISWYVDTDPRTGAHTVALGIPTLIMACPDVVRPEWSGEKGIRQWDSLIAEIESQALKAAERNWGD